MLWAQRDEKSTSGLSSRDDGDAHARRRRAYGRDSRFFRSSRYPFPFLPRASASSSFIASNCFFAARTIFFSFGSSPTSSSR